MDVSDPEVAVRLNIGAGNKVIDGWLNVGLEDHHDIRADIRDLSVLEDDVADEAMAIHVVEHILPWQVPGMLKEWLRVLKPGATLAIECPDIVKCAKNLIAGRADQEGMFGIYGDSRLADELMLHRYGYTAQTVKNLLRDAGFIKVKETSPHFHGKRAHRDMRVECRKPEEQ